MLTTTSGLKIYVYTRSTDMRKGINGLSGLVREAFGADPTDGSLFVFINRRRDRLKILFFSEGGFWLYYRVLESGTFETLNSQSDEKVIHMDSTELAMLLSGVSLAASRKRRKRFRLKQDAHAA